MSGPLIQQQPIASTSTAPSGFSFKNSTLEEVLEDLSSRFILNLPEEELVSVPRICFQVEQAHWYYEDFIREEEPQFPSMALKTFSRHLFHACPLLRGRDHDQAFQDFLEYKTSVPVCGVIMLNPSWSKCVLVKGWKSSSSWSFPRGKINADEPEHECAAREALEETGCDVSDKIIMDAVIRITVKDQKTTLFVVPNIPEDTAFAARTRKEISKIDWFSLADLPTWKKSGTRDTPNHKFYGIAPFIAPLKAIMKGLRKAERERNISQRAAQTNDTSQHTRRPDLPDDPAILSIQSKPEADHMNRLLGGLDISNQSTLMQPSTPAITSLRTANSGALPTPQATPSAPAATKVNLPASLERPAKPKRAGPPIFASPTPPHSGDSIKSCNNSQPPKSKFEFFSPFDALTTPPKKRTEACHSTKKLPVAEVVTSALTSIPNDSTAPPSESLSITKPGRSRAPSAAEHFAPASIARARIRSRQPSQSSTASIISPINSVANPSPLPKRVADIQPKVLPPSRHAKHAALLQSLAHDLFSKSSNSTPAPGFGSKPVFMDHGSGTASHHSLLPSMPQPNGSLPNLAQANGKECGVFFPSALSSISNGTNPYVNPDPIHSVSPPKMNGNNISYISNSRSVTPKVAYPPRDGGGPGSPIPVVLPANPLQRDQLLVLLNSESSKSASSQQQALFTPRPEMVPPQLARKHYRHQHSLRPVPGGGSTLQGVPTVPPPAQAAASDGGPLPAAAPVVAPAGSDLDSLFHID